MGEIACGLLVFFEDPFWVGVFERTEKGKLSASRVVFGAEPNDQEIYGFVLRQSHRLQFSLAVNGVARKRASNPKRLQRQAQKQLACRGLGTKSQQALPLQKEQGKLQKSAEAKRKSKLWRRKNLKKSSANEKPGIGADNAQMPRCFCEKKGFILWECASIINCLCRQN